MKQKLLLLSATLAVAAAGSYFLLGKRDSAPKARAAAPVSVAQAALADVPLSLDLVGRAEAYESVTLKARIDGQVAEVLFQEGQHVRQGDVLVRLDTADLLAKQKQAEATLAASQAQAAKAAADLERYIALRQKGFISDEKLNEVRTTLAAQDASLKAAEAALMLARNQLAYATLRAPFSGIVGARLVYPGSAIKVNDTAVAVVNRIKPLMVSFAVAEKYLPALQAAMKQGAMNVEVSLPGAAQSAADAPRTTRVFPGRARFLDNAVDTASGTIRMKAQLDNADEALTAGQFLNVSLVLESRRNAVTVPAAAIQQGPTGPYVYVVKDDQSAEMRKVAVAATRNGLAAIDQGVAEGETVVTDGQMRLSPGAKVALRTGVAGAEAASNPDVKAPDAKALPSPTGPASSQAQAASR